MKEIRTEKGIFTVEDLGLKAEAVLAPLDDEDRFGGTVTLSTPPVRQLRVLWEGEDMGIFHSKEAIERFIRNFDPDDE